MILNLVVFCFLILLASLVGGWIPLLIRLTHKRMELAVSFVAGVMLGVGMFHMVPHAFHELGCVHRVVWWMMVGLLTMFFVERFFCYHHHVAEPEQGTSGPEENHETCSHHAIQGGHTLGWGGVFTGMTLHTLIAGVALAASVEAEWSADQAVGLAGLGTFLVIFLHKPLDSMTIGTIMAAEGWSVRARHLVNCLFALVIPVGVSLFYLGLGFGTGSQQGFVGCALAFSAGTFLCISLSDLLPELQFHSHDRIKLSLALLLGLALAWTLGLFETCGHGHP